MPIGGLRPVQGVTLLVSRSIPRPMKKLPRFSTNWALSMLLADGDPAHSCDTWSRVITDRKYFLKEGRLHNRAFTGRAIAPPKKERPWSHELSGRLLSLIINLHQEARLFCQQHNKPFEGIMYKDVLSLRRTLEDGINSDVRYTPLDHDAAHSDFVAFSCSTEADLQSLRDFLQETVKAIRPENTASVELLRVDTSLCPNPMSA